MNGCDYEAMIYDGAVHCVGCLPEGVTKESEEVYPIFADSEHDYYPVCESCQREHDYVSLTEYGKRLRYLRSESLEIKRMRAEHDGKLPERNWPGGCTLVYVTKSDAPLCPSCANGNLDADDPVTAVFPHYKGEPIECDACGDGIESGYGDPDSE